VVVGPDGLPLAGAVVSSHPGRAGARVVSGDDGGFAIGDLVPGRYALRAEYAGWPPAELADVEAGARPVQIRLRAAARLEGLVVDSRGRPTTGTTVWARPPSPAGARESVPAPVASTWVDNPEGRFILNGLSPGSYDLIALTAAGQSGSLPRLTVEAGATRSGLRIVLGAGVTVTGKAIDLETRAPMTGVSVRAEGDGRLWQTRTDSSGGFRVAGLPRGLELQLSLEQAGYLAHGRRLVPPLEGDSLELRSLPLLAERPSAGHTGRLGVVIEPREDGQTLIRRAAADMPAYRAGVRDGDMLVTVDNREVTNASASTVVKLLGGPPRTKVVLGIRRGGDALRSIAVERL
jgi:S1-C subfamily serine protease